MAYSIDEIIRLMKEAARLHLQEVKIKEDGQKIVIRGAQVQYTAVTETPVPMAPAMLQDEPAEEAPESGVTVTSPMVGVFYTAPGPEAEPFVKVGDTVRKGQVLCIVEAMKLMNEIESEYDGRIGRVLVQNGDMVEYGQPLFEIETE